jgi:hypothetical protein
MDFQCMTCFGTEMSVHGKCAICGDTMAPITHQPVVRFETMYDNPKSTSQCIAWFNHLFGKELVR